MIPFAWNYTPDKTVTPLLRAVQAHIDYRNLAHGWTPEWSARRVVFNVDGLPATPRQAAKRLRLCPVLTWAHPYHLAGIADAPPEFSTESVDAHAAMVRSAHTMLRRTGLLRGWLDTIHHVTDFEGFAAYDEFPVKRDQDGFVKAPFAVVTDHASTACHLFGEALRKAGFDGPAANYATCHGPYCPSVGGGNNRATPAHVPGSMDGRATFLSGYTTGGPQGCLTQAEVTAGMRGAVWPVVGQCLDDYQPGLDDLIVEAQGLISVLALWGAEEGTPGAEAGNRIHNFQSTYDATTDTARRKQLLLMAEWSRVQDARIAAALSAAGWKGY